MNFLKNFYLIILIFILVSLNYASDLELKGNYIQGDAAEKNLFDVNIGYKFSDNFAIDISATNLFDDKYRAMPGLPVIGRRTLAKATYNF